MQYLYQCCKSFRLAHAIFVTGLQTFWLTCAIWVRVAIVSDLPMQYLYQCCKRFRLAQAIFVSGLQTFSTCPCNICQGCNSFRLTHAIFASGLQTFSTCPCNICIKVANVFDLTTRAIFVSGLQMFSTYPCIIHCQVLNELNENMKGLVPVINLQLETTFDPSNTRFPFMTSRLCKIRF